jgi:tetratricopeptide (TPR) repeat protein
MLRIVAVPLALGWLSVGTLHATDYEYFYKKGIKAFDTKNWEDAEEYLDKAIKINNEEDPEMIRIYGTLFLPYLPHYYRGIALCELDRCDEALVELKESVSQNALEDKNVEYYQKKIKSKIIDKFKDYKPGSYRTKCEIKLDLNRKDKKNE